jgi:hypothetical protein
VETEEEAEAIALELERLGHDCWIEEAGNHGPTNTE